MAMAQSPLFKRKNHSSVHDYFVKCDDGKKIAQHVKLSMLEL